MANKRLIPLSLPKAGPFNQDSIDKLTQSLQDNPALKRAAIKSIRNDTFDFMERVFTLTRAQKLTFQTAISKELRVILGELFILSLNNPDVTFTKIQNEGSSQITLDLKLTSTPPSLRTLVMEAKGSPTKKPTKPGKPTTKPPKDVVVKGGGNFETRC